MRDLVVDSFASFWMAGAVLGALSWGRLKTGLLAMTVALLALWLSVAFTPLVAWFGHGLVRRDALAPADAVLVMASRLQPDGQPSAAALARLLHALELTVEAKTKHLVVPELAPPAPSYGALARHLASRLGVTVEIASTGPVQRTREEAVQAAALCRREGWRRLLVVTSPTHSRRACAAVEQEGLDVICSPAMETEYDIETLDRPSDRFIAFRSVLHEWLGVWLYHRRGWA